MSNAYIQTSNLVVPVFGTDPPDQARVMRQLTAAFPEWGPVGDADDDEMGEDVPWMLVASIPGLPLLVHIWPEYLEDFPEEAWWGATDVTEQEREEIDDCIWCLCIETEFDGGDARELWRVLLKTALALSDDTSLFYDDTSIKLITRERAESVVELPSLPAAQELYSLHAHFDENDDTRFWMHTHGLDRAGLPDLDIFNVPSKYRSTASQLIALLAERMLDGKLEFEQNIDISPELKVRLMPLERVINLVAPDDVGSEFRRGQMHNSSRAAIATIPHGQIGEFSFFANDIISLRMDEFLSQLEAQEVVLQTRAEVERRQDLARFRWGQFIALWRQQEPGAWTFMVCVAIGTGTPDPSEEQLWFEVQRMEATAIVGRLINAPLFLNGLELGDIRRLAADDICDWSIATPDGVYSPANVVQLARRKGISIISPKPVH